jgi:hypothetical protein
LTHLDAYGNQLTTLPDFLMHLPHLTEIHLERNLFTPQEMDRLRKMLPHVRLHF